MHNWRQNILERFIPRLHRLTLVSDPDGLLAEESLAMELEKRGFDLIEYDDAVEFRYAYEKKYRSIWDNGENTDLVVVLRIPDTDLDSLPYDLLQAGKKMSFSLGEIFPNLSPPIIESLDLSLLDNLFEAQQQIIPDRMGDNATIDFVLRYVFGIDAHLINKDHELFKTLIHLHYGKIILPVNTAERLINVLATHKAFKDWPLDLIVESSDRFYEFLQERWPLFLERYSEDNQVAEMSPAVALNYSGPQLLPFDHDDIRIYIDNLFVEGRLLAMKAPKIIVDETSWMMCGVANDSHDNLKARIDRMYAIIKEEMPGLEARHEDWSSFALQWAELNALICSFGPNTIDSRLLEQRVQLNEIFSEWLTTHYSSLMNIPPSTPAMLHHVPRRLSRDRELNHESRVALIVIDGLAMDQWVTLRQIIKSQKPGLSMLETAVFAWIPTITSVSRQSIFSGKPPLYFPGTITSSNSEEKLWRQFWEGNGLTKHEIAYQRSLGSSGKYHSLDQSFDLHEIRALGLVVDKVDKIMHGMQLGSAGMHNQVQQWAEKGFLSSLITDLLDLDFDVWLTSDHGNIECQGKGRPAEGVIAETRGERVRVYPTQELRSQVSESFSFAHKWEPIGLPSEYFPLVISDREAFVTNGETIVGHGGISLEEVIVPLIKFSKSDI